MTTNNKNILEKCLERLENMSQDEFNATLIAKGLKDKNYDRNYEDEDLVLVFPEDHTSEAIKKYMTLPIFLESTDSDEYSKYVTKITVPINDDKISNQIKSISGELPLAA